MRMATGDDIAVKYKCMLCLLKDGEKGEEFQAGSQGERESSNHGCSIWGGIFELRETYSVSEMFR